MAQDSTLTDRVTDLLVARRVSFEKRAMMGGICFMVDDKMCVCVTGNRLMVRLDPALQEESLQRPGCKPMAFTGRSMKGFVYVYAEGHESDSQLRHWVGLALAFNPKARSSKQRPRGKR